MRILMGFVLAGAMAAQQATVRTNVQVRTVQSSGESQAWVSAVAVDTLAGRPVKGAPYSGESVTEFTQTLADGTRIHRLSSTKLARDSEGRTRQEHLLPGDGPMIVTIHDPVADVTYTLNDRDKTARKLKPFSFKIGEGERVEVEKLKEKVKAAADDVVFERHVALAGPASAIAPAAPMIAGVAGQMMVLRGKSEGKSESLGKQTIEGVECEGTRVTTTTAAGEIGNDRPLTTTAEKWYSPELQVLVLSRTNDPMSGETVYRLTNIRRAEPDRGLFEVPPGYTIEEGGAPGPVHIIRRDRE